MTKDNISEDMRHSEDGLGVLAWITDVLLCLSSYTPMFAALALRFDCPPWLRKGCIGLTVLGAIVTLYFLWAIRLKGDDAITVKVSDDRDADVSGYLATYLLPLVVVGTPTRNDILAYALVLIVMALVYVRSRAIQINPMFYVLTFRLFLVTNEKGVKHYLLARKEPRNNDLLIVKKHGHLLLLVRNKGVSSE